MDRWNNRVAVVTGASSGIGKAIAGDLVKAGLRVVALGRRIDRLEKNRSGLPKPIQDKYYPRQVDITNEADVKATFAWIEEKLGGTDILVNNAGILRFGMLVDIDTTQIDEVINTNVKGLIYATQATFKSMKARNFNGHIVNINSVLGHKVSNESGFNIYGATKFAVTAINEILRNELRALGTKIKTTSISPGLVRTEAVPKESADQRTFILEPEDISQAVLFAISTPEHVQIHELMINSLGDVL